jgi:Zn-dependent hydrolases, including glyoxylases
MKKSLLLLLIATFSMNNTTAVKAESNEENIITFAVGSFMISTLSEGGGNGNASLLSGVTEDVLKKYMPDGTFQIQTNAFLVKTGDKNILIDAGYGKNLFDNLNSLDVTEDKVDVILITHMHGDHIGGLLKNGKVAFPNAELYVSQAEHDYWISTNNNANIRNIFEAYKSKLHLFEPADLGSNKQNLFTGFQGIKAYGHTPGHTVFMIESEGNRLMVWGDITHATVVQMPHPEITISFDVNPDEARESRKKIMEYVAKNKIRIAGMHIVFPSVGEIRVGSEEEGAYTFTPACLCEGI